MATQSDRNLRRAILLLEATRAQQYPFTANQKIMELEWQTYLRETANQILSDQTPAKLEKVRDRLYELLAQGIPADTIFKTLVENLVKKCDMTLKAKTVEFACVYEHRMQQGSKHIFHLEAFVANFMVSIKSRFDYTNGYKFIGLQIGLYICHMFFQAIYKKFLNEMAVMDDF